MQRVLITGGAGFLGSVLTPTLLAAGYHVTVLDSFLFRQSTLLDCCKYDTLEIVRGDCRDESLLKKLLTQADIVLPLAALVGAPLCDQNRIGAVTTNQDAVTLLCRLASPQQIIVYPTTNSGYGVGQQDVFCTEDTPLRPISLYGVTKVEAEKAVLDRGQSVSLRLATVFGLSPRMRLDLLVNDFVYRAVHDRSVVLFEADFKRNFIHIQDVAGVFLFALQHFDAMRGRAFNVGLDDANLSKRELCQKIQTHVPGFLYFEAPIGKDPDQRNYIVSNARLAAEGFKPQWSLDRGMRELVKGFTILKQSSLGNV